MRLRRMMLATACAVALALGMNVVSLAACERTQEGNCVTCVVALAEAMDRADSDYDSCLDSGAGTTTCYAIWLNDQANATIDFSICEWFLN